MHSKQLAHCDLKCENVMLQHLHDSTYSAFLGDFGSACDSKAHDGRGPAGTVRFMAPELHNLVKSDSGSSTPSPLKADIFSFAFIMWILISNVEYEDPATKRQLVQFKMNPWSHGNGEVADMAIKEEIVSGRRPSFRGVRYNAWYAYYDLVEQCWSQDPNQRPDFDMIEEMLASLAIGCVCPFRESKGSLARSNASTNMSSNLQTLALKEALTRSTVELRDKFGCTWDHFVTKVEWRMDEIGRFQMRTLRPAERSSWDEADRRLKEEVERYVCLSGMGRNLFVFQGDDARWTLDQVTALRLDQRCVCTVLKHLKYISYALLCLC
jgi:serine/threonine protein kinase